MKTTTKPAPKAAAKAAPKAAAKAASAEPAVATPPAEIPYGRVVAVQAAPYTQPPTFVRKKPVGS